ncbi:MAG: TlpA family protein disulfide reductase [Bacteroidales bacterium]|jgi:thiol-disulfide isomerase/thioredoxin|nr:TlpA family protein disulfide reductase [Bacteroidales bacterium]
MRRSVIIIILIVMASPFSFSQQKIGINPGNKAPEISGRSISGETIRLSDTKGKVVLLDFWAAWCGPCRKENPIVVNVYRKYKNKNFSNGKGFTVFSVSLDRTEASWKKAVKDDKLEWEYHISDLKGWYSKYAAIFGVRRIPSNFLIDGNGIIIARDLRGPDLDAKLEKLLK